MTDMNQIASRYIDVWNETDAGRRRALLTDGWTETARYVDPLMQGQGRDQIEALIGAVHERFPGFRFRLDGRVDGFGDNIRFSWALGPQAQPDVIKGTDFVVTENGRLKDVTGFLDKVPG